MLKPLHACKMVNKLLSPIISTTIVSERREVGVQIADFVERKQRQKLKIQNKELIKNQPWLG
jgi:hypothetical protein